MAWKCSRCSDMGEFFHQQMLKDRTIPECFKVIVDDEDPVPVCILRNPAYPLLAYLMKEVSSGDTTPEEEFFFISSVVSKNGCGMCF